MIEQSDSFSDMPGSLWQFKIDEGPANNAELTIDNSQSFKKIKNYKVLIDGRNIYDQSTN